ncbi:MAG: hypothetical protein RH859_05950 [Longimicrobiales bacterium]
MSVGHGPAGNELARDRLSLYVRYADLTAEQEAALEAGDMEQFEALSRDLEELRTVIGSASGPPRPVQDGPESGSPEFVRQATDVLRATLARTERIQMRLAVMRRDRAREIRSVAERAPQLRNYAVAGGAAPETNRVDFTF